MVGTGKLALLGATNVWIFLKYDLKKRMKLLIIVYPASLVFEKKKKCTTLGKLFFIMHAEIKQLNEFILISLFSLWRVKVI